MHFEFGTNLQVGEKNLQNWENTGLFWIGKQPVLGCKIGYIKSLYYKAVNLARFMTMSAGYPKT